MQEIGTQLEFNQEMTQRIYVILGNEECGCSEPAAYMNLNNAIAHCESTGVSRADIMEVEWGEDILLSQAQSHWQLVLFPTREDSSAIVFFKNSPAAQRHYHSLKEVSGDNISASFPRLQATPSGESEQEEEATFL